MYCYPLFSLLFDCVGRLWILTVAIPNVHFFSLLSILHQIKCFRGIKQRSLLFLTMFYIDYGSFLLRNCGYRTLSCLFVSNHLCGWLWISCKWHRAFYSLAFWQDCVPFGLDSFKDFFRFHYQTLSSTLSVNSSFWVYLP